MLDSSNPIITNDKIGASFNGTNTGLGNAANGVALNGSASPMITNDLITGSGHNGLNILSSASPQITNDTFSGNAANGVAVQLSNNPNVTNDTITGSGEDGLSILSSANPRSRTTPFRATLPTASPCSSRTTPTSRTTRLPAAARTAWRAQFGQPPGHEQHDFGQRRQRHNPAELDDPNVTHDTVSGNSANGINVVTSNTAQVANDTITGSGANGVNLLDSSLALIVSNTITGNSANGIFLNSSTTSTIGGTTAGARNIISGNRASGIDISGQSGSDASNNLVEGNYVGLDANGNRLANSVTGLLISNASNNMIGGLTTTPGQGPGNVFSGNQLYGIEIANSATGNQVKGNSSTSRPAMAHRQHIRWRVPHQRLG